MVRETRKSKGAPMRFTPILALVLLPLLVVSAVPRPVFAQSRVIRDNIVAELERYPTLGAHDISIDARYDTVTLDGTVASRESRALVEKIAAHQPGVHQVINRLEVQSLAVPSTNPELAQEIKAALARSHEARDYSVSIMVQGDQVTLSGDAETAADRDTIGRIAGQVPGVHRVTNKIAVRVGLSDEEISQRIRAALASDPQVNLQSVQVQVRNGIATFTGTTHNHRETDRILSIAIMVPGVRDIRSDIKQIS